MMLPAAVITPYLPGLVLHHFAGESNRSSEAHTIIDAAVLFTDISGFTPLAESLARHGREGSEELGRLLNAYYEPLIEEIAAHGGDVAKMAGDALIAVWPVGEGEPLASVTLRASQCALAVQEKMCNYELGDGVRLSLKAGISTGALHVLHVGGVLDRWEMVIAGEPVVQMGAAEKLARPGDVVLTPHAWQLVGSSCSGEQLPGNFVRLTSILRPLGRMAIALPEPAEESLPALYGYIAGAIRSRLGAGQEGWLSEMRPVTVLFVHLHGFGDEGDDVSGRANRVMRSLQEAIYSQEGSLNKLSVDEKGITLLAALGLPPLAHGDDPARGVLAGLAIRDALAQLGERCEIGITTGRAYCGEVGGNRRREYTLIGDVVNLAARLMQASATFGNILCDEATAHGAKSRLEFETLPPISVKGKSAPIPVYRPCGVVVSAPRSRPLFGRERERASINRALEDVSEGRGGLLIIEGDAGLGKSVLIRDLLASAGSRYVEVLVASADPIETITPYFAWRSILSALLGIDVIPDPQARRDHVRNRFKDRPQIETMLPLLDDVLGLELPPTEVTEQMIGEVRADNTRALLLRLITEKADSGPLTIVLEDAHWLDSTSWSLAAAVAKEVPQVLLVISTRPRADWPESASMLVESGKANRLLLVPLSSTDLLSLVCESLGVSEVPESIATLIYTRAEGNPLYGEELALSLRDAGLIRIEGSTCRLAPGVVTEEITLPDSMRGAILGRIDRLGPSQQLTLKSASVIGRVFQARVLQKIHPIESDRPQVNGHLSKLVSLDFAYPQPATQDDAHAFKHVITQEVAYDLMLREQRRALHRDVALWYERESGTDLAPLYAMLAFHWFRAEDFVRAAEYFDLAGERAFRGGSYREAIHFLTRSEALLDRNGIGNIKRDQIIGECHLALGVLGASRQYTTRVLRLLGYPVPSTRLGQATSLMLQIGRQILRRLWPTKAKPVQNPDRIETLRRASAADAVIGQLCYYDHELLLGVHSAFRSLNLAEIAGPSPELARAYATASIAASLVPLSSVSNDYARRATKAAESIDDLQAKAWVFELVGITDLNAGRWTEARQYLEAAMQIADRINDHRRWSEAAGELARVEFHRGNFARGRELFASQYERATRQGHIQARTWGLHGQAICCLRMGQDAEALALLKQSPAIAGESDSVTDAVLGTGLLAVAYLRLGDHKSAKKAAESTVHLIGSTAPMVSYSLDGYAGAAEVLLALAEEEKQRSSRTARNVAVACSALRRYARVFPIARPRASLFTGREHLLNGHQWRASKAWKRALRLAEQLDMPYEIALARNELETKVPEHAP